MCYIDHHVAFNEIVDTLYGCTECAAKIQSQGNIFLKLLVCRMFIWIRTFLIVFEDYNECVEGEGKGYQWMYRMFTQK